MHNHFYCVPIGETARTIFYEELKNVQYHESLMVLSNRTLVTIAQKEGYVNAGVWDNLLNIILGLAEKNSFIKIGADVPKIIIKGILKDEKEYAYFSQLKYPNEKAGISEKPGLVEGIYGLYNETKRKGISLSSLAEFDKEVYNGDLRCSRGEEIEKIANLYQQKCAANGVDLIDLDSRYDKAIEILEDKELSQRLALKIVAFCDLYEFTAPQLKIIELLNNLGIETYVSLPYEKGNRENLYSFASRIYAKLCNILGPAEFVNYSSCESDLDNLRVQFNVKVTDKKIVEHKKGKIVPNEYIRLLSFINREEEMRWVLSEVKSKLLSGVNANDIVVAARSLDQYSGLRSIADEYGIAMNRALVTKLSSQPISEFVLDFIMSLQNSAEGAMAYFRLINSPAAKSATSNIETDILTMPSQKYFTSRKQAQNAIDRYIAEEKIAKNDFLVKFDELIARYDTMASKKLDEYIKLVHDALDLVADRKTLGSLYANNEISISELKLAILSRDTINSAIQSKIADYKLLNIDGNITLSEFSSIVRECIEEENIVIENGKKNGVRFCSVVELTGQRIPYVFILGNREDEFPAPSKRRWLYTEQDRELLKDRGIELLSKKTDYEYDAIFFAQAIASATEKLYLTWFRDPGVSDASAGCSVFVDYVKQYFDNVDYVAIRHTDISSSREKDIAERSPECDRKDYTFKGVDLDETTSQELWKKIVSKKFSASSLGNYKKCPLRYLAAKVWKADKKDVLDDSPNVAHLGTLVHDVLETFIKDNVIPSGKTIQSSDYAELWKSLQTVFNKKAEEFEEKGYFGGPLWTIAKYEKLALLERWLKYEHALVEASAEFKPCATEWAFGYGDDHGYQINLQKFYDEEPEEERTASFCGKVDRFDKNDKGEISIIDYKTGNAPKKDDIQVPLYVLAVDKLYKDTLGKDLSIQSGSYLELKGLPAKKSEIKIPFGFTDKGNYSYAEKNLLEYDECLEYFEKLITNLLDGIHKGAFLIDINKLTSDSCKYCPLEKYCTAKSMEEENE